MGRIFPQFQFGSLKNWALLLFGIPLLGLYTNCQALPFLGGGFEVDPFCKVSPPSPFQEKKLILDEAIVDSLEGPAPLAKATDEILPHGLDLVMVVDTACLRHRRGLEAKLAEALLGGRQIRETLSKQAFRLTLKRDWRRQDLESQLDEDECIVGMSLNREYSLSSLTDPQLSVQRHHLSLRTEQALVHFFHPDYGMEWRGPPLAKVAIVDSGVDSTHPDLASALWHPLWDGEIMDAPPSANGVDVTTLNEMDVVYDASDIDFVSGHGTHVAGLAAALGNNRVAGAGVMPARVQIMALRAFALLEGELVSSSDVVVNAIQFAISQGADVINLSLGSVWQGSVRDPAYADALRDAVDAGVVVVMAMGNSSASIPAGLVDGENLTVLPAYYAKDYPGAISVASVDTADLRLSSFSHYGPATATLAAPGAQASRGFPPVGLYSTRARQILMPPSEVSPLFLDLPGTSMAAPLVAGAAALTVALYRHHGLEKPSAAQVEAYIVGSVRKSPHLSGLVESGGMLDLRNLVDYIHREDPRTTGSTERTDFSSEFCP